jgi:putative transposase
LRKAIRSQGLPEKLTIDKSGANTAAITHYNKTHKTASVIRHSKYLKNIVEQDPRAVTRLVRPLLGFTSFWAARCRIAGIAVMHAIRKGPLAPAGDTSQTPAAQCYALAAEVIRSDQFRSPAARSCDKAAPPLRPVTMRRPKVGQDRVICGGLQEIGAGADPIVAEFQHA